MKKINLPIIALVLFFSCDKEVSLTFKEESIEISRGTEISLNYPKAEGKKEIANQINAVIERHIASQINFSDDSSSTITIIEAIKKFNNEFKDLKNNFSENSQKWKALIDGEVTYNSPNIISIAINSYLDTGGAHGNTNVQFFNFNSQTGQLLSTNSLISDVQGLSEVIKNKLNNNIKGNITNESIEDFFFGKDFQLPETLGFSDEGLIILYNPYEIASYSQGIVEFTIPFSEVKQFLNLD